MNLTQVENAKSHVFQIEIHPELKVCPQNRPKRKKKEGRMDEGKNGERNQQCQRRENVVPCRGSILMD